MRRTRPALALLLALAALPAIASPAAATPRHHHRRHAHAARCNRLAHLKRRAARRALARRCAAKARAASHSRKNRTTTTSGGSGSTTTSTGTGTGTTTTTDTGTGTTSTGTGTTTTSTGTTTTTTDTGTTGTGTTGTGTTGTGTTTTDTGTSGGGTTSSPSPTALGWLGFGGAVFPGATWRPYAASSPFNQTADGVALHPSSAGIVSTVLSWGLPGSLVDAAGATNDWAHPTYYALPTDPVFTLDPLKGSQTLAGMQIRIPDDAKPAAGGDGHMTVVEPDGWEYDFWQVQSKPAGGGTMTFNGGGRTRIDGDGRGSYGTASGFGNLAGMIRAQELAAGHIDHALFIVVKCTAKSTGFGFGTQPSSQSWDGSFVYPATHPATACSTDSPNLPPAGARFQLAMSDSQIAALAVPAWKKTILTALAHYGGYVGDTGGSGFNFMFEDSTMYTSLGDADPLAAFARANGVPTWNGQYVFNMASGVDWAKYLRVLVPPAQ